MREAFVKLWEDKLLYRAQRLINWCPRCKTALADIEVVHEEADGSLWHIRYPLADDPAHALIVATTRPETMLGDTAVAVHPDDERYQGWVGKKIRLPITGRIVPLIADPFVDREFGTGALKITPGHDFNDFDIGERFGLDKVSIFDADARIDAASFLDRGESGEWIERYRGKDRFEARKFIVAELKEKGFLEKTEPHKLAVGRCYRCQTVIEPYLTPQWFVDIKPLAEPAMAVVREGTIKIIPEGWSNSYFAWMENIKDWCISRQIWWGHQIPAWYCLRCEASNLIKGADGEYRLGKDAKPIVARQAPEKCPTCGGKESDSRPRRARYLVFFRLVAVLDAGLARSDRGFEEFLSDFDACYRFRHSFFLGCAHDHDGTQIHGRRAVSRRLHPCIGARRTGTEDVQVQGQRHRSARRHEPIRHRCVPLHVGRDGRHGARYQARRRSHRRLSEFRQQTLERGALRANEFERVRMAADGNSSGVIDDRDLGFAERWIRSRLAFAIAEARKAIDSYRFNDYANVLYQFTWHEFCDWYIEMSKLALNSADANVAARSRKLLRELLDQILLLLHPVMPFVTEEIWQVLGDNRTSIMVQPYPVAQAGLD